MSERCGDLVIRVHGGHHYVQTDEGIVDCTIRGRLKRGRRGSDLVAIGDRVCWTPTEEGFGIIESVAPRTRVLSRRPRRSWVYSAHGRLSSPIPFRSFTISAVIPTWRSDWAV